jgi:chemotaxis family two-component system response regulator Rcp1
MSGVTKTVLLIEDNAGDIVLTREAFRAGNMDVDLDVATDGVEALAILRREGAHAHAARPDLILLDLNLPRLDGREVLARIKADENLKSIPTIILTASESPADIAQSYLLKANCFLAKPMRFDEYEGLMKSINDFWLKSAKLPSKSLAT